MDSLLILTLLTVIICLLGLSWFAGSDAPFVPTEQNKINAILASAGCNKNRIFYELGSGDGRVVIEAAKLGTQANGIEQSWIRVLYSKFRARRLGLKNTHFYHGNIFDRNYNSSDIVYIYMLPKAVGLLENKLRKELRKGSKVITQTYHFKNWKPFKKHGNFWIYKV